METKPEKRAAMLGNNNAKKSDDDKASSFIHARCTPAEKAVWVRRANAENLKLTEWIIKNLNAAAEEDRPKQL